MSDVSNVVKEETAKQTIILVFTVLTVIATTAAIHSVADWRTVKMTSALVAKRICQHEVDRWQRWADNAATAYNREKA